MKLITNQFTDYLVSTSAFRSCNIHVRCKALRLRRIQFRSGIRWTAALRCFKNCCVSQYTKFTIHTSITYVTIQNYLLTKSRMYLCPSNVAKLLTRRLGCPFLSMINLTCEDTFQLYNETNIKSQLSIFLFHFILRFIFRLSQNGIHFLNSNTDFSCFCVKTFRLIFRQVNSIKTSRWKLVKWGKQNWTYTYTLFTIHDVEQRVGSLITFITYFTNKIFRWQNKK